MKNTVTIRVGKHTVEILKEYDTEFVRENSATLMSNHYNNLRKNQEWNKRV